MISVQLGAAYSTHLFDSVGPAGTAWLRLTMGALIFLAITRPRLRGVGRRDLLVVLALGVATGLLTTAFLSAVARIPLGTAVAIEFLGPLGVAVARSHDRRSLVWPGLALVGVVLLTEPWQGDIDALGVGFAALSAVCWATYIVLTRKSRRPVQRSRGALHHHPRGRGDRRVARSAAGLGPHHLAGPRRVARTGAALPVLPFSLELVALRRLTTAAFGTLMALEPAIGVVAGVVVLSQVPRPLQVVGVVLVVAAGVGAERNGHRDDGPDAHEDSPIPLGTA